MQTKPIIMRTLLFSFLFVTTGIFAQSASPFQKYEIGTSGCSQYFPSKPTEVRVTKDTDGSTVYKMESEVTNSGETYSFGTIVVKLDGATANESKLKDYLDKLQKENFVIDSEGYASGKTLSTHAPIIGITDSWLDFDTYRWSISAWASGNYLVIQYVYGASDFSDSNTIDSFFKGIRFPGD